MAPELIAIVGALLLHAGAFVWWASKINILVEQLVHDVRDLKAAANDLEESAAGRIVLERIRMLEQR